MSRLCASPSGGLFGFVRAGLLLCPSFFFRELTSQSFPVWTLQVGALSVAITWLYAQTRGSLLLTMLLHSAVNQTVGIVPSANPNPGNPFSLDVSLVMWLTAALLWITALYFLVRMPKVELSGADSAV